MGRLPFMKLFVDDHLAATEHMTCREVGAYMRLLFCLWRNEGKIPMDMQRMAIICKVGKAEMAKIWDAIASQFREANGLIYHNAVELLLFAAKERSAQCSQAVSVRYAQNETQCKIRPYYERTTNVLRSQISDLRSQKTDSDPEADPEKKTDPDQTPKPPKGAVEFDSDFSLFWKAYPRRKNKGQAIKAWKATQKARPVISVIIAAIKSQCASRQWTSDGGKFIPYPASWLNGMRWEDEPDSQQQVTFINRLCV